MKERTDHTRFARGTSQTFQALEGLVDKGVKVDIGIPKELWHKPSAEVSNLKTQVGKFSHNWFIFHFRIHTIEVTNPYTTLVQKVYTEPLKKGHRLREFFAPPWGGGVTQPRNSLFAWLCCQHTNFQCETLLEQHEEVIEDWYFKRQSEVTLEDYLCRQRALKSEADKYCLGKSKGETASIKGKKKSKKKKKDEL